MEKTYGAAVSGLMLHMLDIANGKSSSVLISDLETNINENFNNLIQNYNTSFRSGTDVSDEQKSISVTLPPKAMHHHLATTKRLIPNVGKFKQQSARKRKTTHPIAIPLKSATKTKLSSC